MLKRLVVSLLLTLPVQSLADTALIQLGPDGRPLALPIASQSPVQSSTGTVTITTTPPIPPTSVTQTGSLPPPFPLGYIYYTLPGGINLTTPWSAGILAEGWDFVGRESITQGYLPFAQWWKITIVGGAGINSRKEGSPLGGGIISLLNTPIGSNVDFHLAATGGYNVNEKKAMAVLSGSVQFLK